MAVNDKHGNLIEEGAEVIVRCRVLGCNENQVHLQTVEGTERYPQGTELRLQNTQIEITDGQYAEVANVGVLQGQPVNAQNVTSALPRNQPIFQRKK